MRGVSISNASTSFGRNVDLHRQHGQVTDPYAVQPRRPYRILTFADEGYASRSDAVNPSVVFGQNSPTSSTRYRRLELITLTKRPRAVRTWLNPTCAPHSIRFLHPPWFFELQLKPPARDHYRYLIPETMKRRFSWTVTERGVHTPAKISWAPAGCDV